MTQALRRHGLHKLFNVRALISYLLMLLVAIVTVGPFILMVSMSLQADFKFFYFPFPIIPPNPTLDNYAAIFQRSLIDRWIFNSMFVTIAAVFLQVFTASLAGYAFARGEFPGRDLIFWLFMGTLMIPGTVTIVPLFILLSYLDWVDTYLALILPFAVSIFGTFLIRQYILGIPRDYDEAALMDGAGHFRIWWSIVSPLCKPAIITLVTLSFLSEWNAFLIPLILMQSEEMKTLPVGLASMLTETGNAGMQMASATIGFIPTFLVFVLAQRFLVGGITLGGVKG
ncbi:carbohydrate ABC transporter permease [Chloroflexi bacterium TSY]|nr:carbohydrate ABC transporter permease [Chloroflexi bacterium TSY]